MARQGLITPEMLINRTPHKLLSPFKVRRRGARAFWGRVKQAYPNESHHGSDRKSAHDHAHEAVESAFILGWKDLWNSVDVSADIWLHYIDEWKSDGRAMVEHLRAAYLEGRAFYEEQFPAGTARPELHHHGAKLAA